LGLKIFCVMSIRSAYVLVLSSLLLAVICPILHAQWMENGVLVATSRDGNFYPQHVSDGGNGAFIVWRRADGELSDIWSQRLLSSGVVAWQPDGVAVCSTAGMQDAPHVVEDGSGGMIVVWQDKRSGDHWDIYAQRIGPAGDALWTEGGVPVCTVAGDQWLSGQCIVRIGSGNAVIVWHDERSGESPDIFAQSISLDGALIWQDDGATVCAAPGSQTRAHVVGDGAAGAFVVWMDDRTDSYGDIYAQCLNSGGNPLWIDDGIVVCSAPYYQREHQVTKDGTGGVIVVWEDYRNGEAGALNFDYSDIFSQRLNAAGDILWTIDGVAVTDILLKVQRCPQIVNNNEGECMVAWEDYRADKYGDIYIQCVDDSGNARWMAQGLPVCELASKRQLAPQLEADGNGGAILIWQDRRDWSTSSDDIYAQRVSVEGDFLWLQDGEAICTAAEGQSNALLISDRAEGAIIVWQDRRNFTSEIYSQRIDAYGEIVPTLLLAHSLSMAGTAVRVEWTVSDWQVEAEFHIMRTEQRQGLYRELATVDQSETGASFVYLDTNCEPGHQYYYRVDIADSEGRRLLFESGPIVVPDLASSPVWSFPNPFRGETTIHYTVEENSRVSLAVYDAGGRLVRILLEKPEGQKNGCYTVEWDGRNQNGSAVPSGVYFYRLTVGRHRSSGKITILR
jgi:hypothetical protein